MCSNETHTLSPLRKSLSHAFAFQNCLRQEDLCFKIGHQESTKKGDQMREDEMGGGGRGHGMYNKWIQSLGRKIK
jgi:hypothetical protein